MTELDKCPHCSVSLRGDEIPVESRKWYGNATHFRREVLVEVIGVYDGGLYFTCPDCDGRWHRWPEGHLLRERAEAYLKGVRNGQG